MIVVLIIMYLTCSDSSFIAADKEASSPANRRGQSVAQPGADLSFKWTGFSTLDTERPMRSKLVSVLTSARLIEEPDHSLGNRYEHSGLQVRGHRRTFP